MSKELTNRQRKWLDDNCYRGLTLGHQLTSMRPDIGFYIKLDEIDVAEDIFPDEFKELIKIRSQILEKLKEHYNKLSDGKL